MGLCLETDAMLRLGLACSPFVAGALWGDSVVVGMEDG